MKEYMASYLKEIIDVPFKLEHKGEEQLIGDGTPRFTVRIRQFPGRKELITSTSLALGEAYMRGDIEVEGDLYEVLSLFMGNMGKFKTDHKVLKNLLFTSTSKRNQKEEVSSHYDIGNDFYRLWLGKTMCYSCGYFKNEDVSLDDAQMAKVDHILAKLHLEEGMSLLDIGCGWGFLLMEAARRYKVKGLGITLSKEQKAQCEERIKAEGLSDLVSVKLMDYRELKGSALQFDRIVSVGMIEHVGRDQYPTFLKAVEGVLKPGGLFLLHYISAQKEYPGDPWIKRYIFPGGVIPSLREIIYLLPEYDFYTLDVESLRRHYNKTLLCWRENFYAHRREIEEMMGVEFARMWDLYLSVCAATFWNGVIDIHQILVSKGINNNISSIRVV